MRILIVEDQPEPRARFQRAAAALDADAIVAATLAEGRAGLAAGPSLLLTDLGLPDGDGTELVAEAYTRNVPSLVITVFGDETRVVRAIEAGASGYLLKDGAVEDVAAAIREVLAGGAPISPRIATHLLKRLRPPTPARPRDVELAESLTAREREVLGLIAKGFSYAEIAEVLTLSPHTVATHVRKVYRKLAVHSRGEAVFEAQQLGII